MAEQSPRMQWPYPAENEDPWWDTFQDFIRAADSSVFAARDDRNLILMGGGTVAFNAGTGSLSWSSQIEIFSPNSGFLNLIPAGNIVLADGQVFRARLTRAPGANTNVSNQQAASFAENSDNSIVLCIRRGSTIYWRNGLLVTAGTSVPSLGISPAVGGTAIAGDVTGTLAASVVERLRGIPIQSATPTDGDVLTFNNTENRWEPKAAAGGGSFVFRPGGTQAGKVYDNWEDLYAAVTLADEKVVIIDDSIDPAEIPAGVYDINGWTLKGLVGALPTLTVLDGATFTASIGTTFILDSVRLVADHTSGYILSSSTSAQVYLRNGASIDGSLNGGDFRFFRIEGFGNPRLTLVLDSGSSLGAMQGNVAETAQQGRLVVEIRDASGQIGAEAFYQAAPGAGALEYVYYGTSPASFNAQSDYVDSITFTQSNDMRYMGEVVFPFVLDAQQAGTTELHVGSVYLKAGTRVLGASEAMIGGGGVGETANLRMRRYTGGAQVGGDFTTIGGLAPAQPLGGEFVIADSDWYDLFIFAGNIAHTAILKGLWLRLVPSVENGL